MAAVQKQPAADVADLPIDRGYAWVIVSAGLFCSMISVGVLRSFGIIFVEFLSVFGESTSKTSLIMAMQTACTSLAGLFIQTIVLSYLTVRQTVITGGCVGALAYVLSYFADSINMLIFTIGVLLGISNALVLSPCLVIVGSYFDKRRSLAMALTVIGASLGSVILPIVTEKLLITYALRGTLLIVGALYLNIVVGGMLLRPLHDNKRKKSSDPDTTPLSTSSQETAREKPQAGDHKTPNSETSIQYPVNATEMHTDEKNLSKLYSLNSSFPDVFVAASIEIENDVDQDSSPFHRRSDIKTNDSEQQIMNGSTYNNVETDDPYMKSEQVLQVEPICEQGEDVINKLLSTEESNQNKASLEQTETVSFCTKLLSTFNFHLFRNPVFLWIMMAFTLSVLQAMMYGAYLPAMAVSSGVSFRDASLLISVYGGCGLISRIVFGFIADLNKIPRVVLMAIVISISSTAGLFTVFYHVFLSLAVFSGIYGTFGMLYYSLFAVVMVDLLGLKNLPAALGFLNLFAGIVSGLSHPFIGFLRDVTGNYHLSYVYISVCGLVGSLMLFCTPLIKKVYEKRLNQMQESQPTRT